MKNKLKIINISDKTLSSRTYIKINFQRSNFSAKNRPLSPQGVVCEKMVKISLVNYTRRSVSPLNGLESLGTH